LDTRLAFFNDSEYGPYRGSIIGMLDEDGNVQPPLEQQVGFGDTWGIYYRYFRWSFGTLWTLAFSLWYLVGVFCVLPLVWLLKQQGAGK